MDYSAILNRVVHEHTAVVKQPIRTYIRLFPSAGIDPILDSQYEILDGKTFLDKRNSKQLIMHPFNYIFTNQFEYSKQIEHMNIIDDCFDGKNQVIIADIDSKQLLQSFMLGTADDPGFVISVFNALFNQAYYQTYSSSQASHKSEQTNNKQQNINNSNKFIDLILGQKFTFYSKKDMDQYKDFYDKQIQSMRQFLIVLKIALIRYKQCCVDGDPIVFRIIIDSFDQVRNCHFSSSIHIVLCQSQSKIMNSITRKIQFSLKNAQIRGEDHGSLANYIQKNLKKCKLTYIYGIPYRKSYMQNSVPMFEFLKNLKNHSYQFDRSIVNMKINDKIDSLNKITLKKYKYGVYVFAHKQINSAIKILQRLCQFLNETQIKWRSYCQSLVQLFEFQSDFYERQRFPISLQIQQFNVKSFLISKVYKLSQTYQMDDLCCLMQKLRTLKNQVVISLRAIYNSKELKHLSNSKNAEDFIKYCNQFLDFMDQKIKQMFGIRYRDVRIYDIKLNIQIQSQTILDNKFLKQIIIKFKNQAKKIKQKQEILLRKLDVQNIDPTERSSFKDKTVQNTKRNQITLSGTKTFQLFRKARRLQNLSELPATSQLQKNINNSQIKSVNKNNYEYSPLQNSSIIITRQSQQNNYNFSLPKIAVIHRKKVKRL